MTDGLAKPVEARGRIASLDVLRGFALLGILVMNIQLFAMPMAAYDNPAAWGDLAGWNLAAWTLGHLFADQKFITLFSILFGAGIALFADRIEARSGRPAPVHYRRMGWLLVFGVAHAYLLWSGDILVAYAVCGCLVYPARRLRPRTLLAVGLASYALPSLVLLGSRPRPHVPRGPRGRRRRDRRRRGLPTPPRSTPRSRPSAGGWTEQQPLRTEHALSQHLFLLPLIVCSGSPGA